MHKIVYKKVLSSDMFWLEFEAPYVAAKAKPGQFIIFRVDEFGERVPLTIAGVDKAKSTVTIIFQAVGRSTSLLSQLEEGESILDVSGPLGQPSHMDGLKRVCVVGGGTGNALAYPIVKGFTDAGIKVDMIAGFKTKDLIVLENEFREASDRLFLMTDDGSAGEKGFTTNKLQELIEQGNDYDEVFTVGPPIMMKMVCKVTELKNIKTVASLTALMIDGTGMCGCCRVNVDGQVKYACVDGPDFDGNHVDWDTLIARNSYYMPEEKEERNHICRLTGGVRHYE